MILFYSIHCKHCQMLMDSIKRFDVEKMIKLVDVFELQKTHPSVFKQLKMVPALMTLPSKEIIYGKAVFDYLLLPSRGKLVTSRAPNENRPSLNPVQGGNMNIALGNDGMVGILHQEEGVMAFNSAKGLYGDSFAGIDESSSIAEHANNNPHTAYNWTSIDEMVHSGSPENKPTQQSSYSNTTYTPIVTGPSANPLQKPPFEMGLETRNSKQEYDIDKLRVQREQDMQSLFGAQTRPDV